MRIQVLAALLAGVLSIGAASATPHASAGRSSNLKPDRNDELRRTLGAAIQASVRRTEEGQRYVLVTTVKSPRRATSMTLQKFDPPEYSFEDARWNDVKTLRVRQRSKVRIVVVAVDRNVERYRAVVRYKNAKPVTTRPVSVTVWRWIPLSDYRPYHETGGATTYGTFGINGRVYKGFGPYLHSHVGYWESRFTPGRHGDTSVYRSPALTPGMSLPFYVPLAKPYRLGIQLSDTSPGGTEGYDEVEAYPAISDPALRCTGL